jgi:hypothetical protein
MWVEDILALARRHFAEVEVLPAGRVGHSKLNAVRLNAGPSSHGELLVLYRAEAPPAGSGRMAGAR